MGCSTMQPAPAKPIVIPIPDLPPFPELTFTPYPEMDILGTSYEDAVKFRNWLISYIEYRDEMAAFAESYYMIDE